jgi:uncharacterized membrane protein YdbT with pleckstrin-like domain
VAHLKIMKIKFEKSKELERERTELLAELQTSCSAEVARTAEQIIEHRRSILQNDELKGEVSMVSIDGLNRVRDSSQRSEQRSLAAWKPEAPPFDSIES